VFFLENGHGAVFKLHSARGYPWQGRIPAMGRFRQQSPRLPWSLLGVPVRPGANRNVTLHEAQANDAGMAGIGLGGCAPKKVNRKGSQTEKEAAAGSHVYPLTGRDPDHIDG